MFFTELQLDKIIKEHQAFFDTGITKSTKFRIEQLMILKKTIKKYEKDVIQALYRDLRKSEFEAYTTEIGLVYDNIAYMVKHLDKWMEPKQVKTPLALMPSKSFIMHDPYGTVLIIAPFNYPFQLVMEPLLGAIAGGNCAVIKPSELTPHTTKIIQKIISETFDPRYIRAMEGEKEETSLLIHAPFDFIFFTGSVKVGKLVMKAAAERLTPIALELGGKSPVIVDHTANLEVAAKRIIWGKFVNAGQTCIAPDYVVVEETVKEKFIELLKQTIVQFYGKMIQDSPDLGRIVNTNHFDRLKTILEREKDQIIFGGKTDSTDLYIEPTLLAGIDFSSPSMEDEIFGPILPIISYTDLPAIIRRIRKLPKPLAAYIFSENERAQQYFLEEFSFGGGCINDTISHAGSAYLPFGGVGNSGVQAYHGEASFTLFTHQKSIIKKSTKLPVNIVFPPYKNKVKLVRTLLK
ncbi:aldehyde dehydrogenase [Psychrobacillus sp. OK032]|uniref:aldehyde dehydrogenase n=1 Tax=Psychrobacillus sp. OK032 TaxID=1884358 RepID=UPI0008B431A1|nr:aldehyde dehydrogenase [Psychrobacillus sp. OK032]SER62120.1 aldehyde dehydrogenase (NAD+) [Psychrobacillus sp. OK032]